MTDVVTSPSERRHCVVSGHDPVRGVSWQVARRPVDPRLAGLLVDACGYAERSECPVTRRQPPHPAVTVILNLGPPIEVNGVARRTFVAGMHDVSATTTFTGAQRGVELRLTPLGARRLFGVAAAELTNVVTPLPLLENLADRLAGESGWDRRLDLVESFVMAADGPDPDPAVAWAWRVMRRRGGDVPVGALATEIGWSRRHFATRFRAEIGLSPKVAARVLRLDRARSLLVRRMPAGLVAARCGYTDQSHLVREFRALAGCTPTAYLAELDGEQVTFVQDHGAEAA
jgi:AraC-like DNA-binding protein